MEELLLRWLPALAALIAMLLSARRLVHDFQLESYQLAGYFRTLKRDSRKALLPGCILCVVGFTLTTVALALDMDWLTHLQLALVLVTGVSLMLIQRKQKAKKPLVFTARVKRLYISLALVLAVGLLLCCLIPDRRLSRGAVALAPVLLPLLLAIAALLVLPVEKLISWLYKRQAMSLLREQPDLITIGVTGSYGKTSTKFILGTILREKYQTLVPPSSFNTPMGLTRIIRSNLRPTHQVFVAEMGARHPGDIKELTRMVRPKYGVLTSVGPQHLDTFKTIERITKTKYDLMEAVPKDGVCFFQNDEGICRKLYDKTGKQKRLCSIRPDPAADVWAEDIAVDSQGSRFRLCTREGSVDCVTPLLGEHNIQNILLSAMVALELGLSLKQIAVGIGKLVPVEHRMQLISNPGGVTVIDDAFNSNPVSSGKALEVLSSFPGRHIVITPGMVELGDKEEEYNREMGRQIARAADVVILVGPRHTRPIKDGALESGFPLDHVHQVNSLEEAAELLKSMAAPGDVVLFENDLPDNYTE